ncbi:HAMP domain-containing sensor histidine kinase [Streptomyces sp. NPDC001941]|uniref:sensor histidine kinase n=1 Tax=Streptomyces sp. NPDC001941 TaxID=3154659 RepID=UPI00331F4C8C
MNLYRYRPGWASSLRWTIAATTTAVCCAVAIVLGTLVHNVVAQQTVGQLRADARKALDEASVQYTYGTSSGAVAVEVDPRELPDRLRALVRGGESGSMVGSRAGKPVMWAAAPADGRALAVWVPYGSTRSHLRDTDTAIIGSSLLAAGLVALAGLFLAVRISRRLAATAEVARRITDGDLDARVGMLPDGGRGDSRDEVLAVATALDSMAGSLQARLEGEKRFTADVAHELRTPLTGVLAAAGLLPEGRPKEMINDRLRALHKLTEDLLEISRLDAGVETPELAEHDLGPMTERAVRATGLDVEVRILRDARVETDRRRFDRVLANLVGNAHRHGAPPVTVTVNGPSVEVRDHGPGYPDGLIEQGPQRFRTGDPGRGRGQGLGLTIVVGQAEVLGAKVEFSHAKGGGARTVVRLPRATSHPPDA